MNIYDKVFIQTTGEIKVLLKSDWFAVAIATFGTAMVTYYGWSVRNENPIMKKILYTLLVFMLILWGLCTFILLSYNG